MHYLVNDMTHGGVKIAVSLAKKGKNVYAYDIYNTLNSIDKRMLEIYNVEVIGLDYLKKLKGNIKVISPIHFPLTEDEIRSNNPSLNYTFITHHQAVNEILENWGEDILKIEVTGVKGKTSCVFMLKEILIDENPLILSSLGAILYENKIEHLLKRDISITPANIKECIDLAYKYANPICNDNEARNYSSAIFESSLGACGIGDVGLLTNIAENYPIAKNRLDAFQAKEQIFNCSCVAIEKEAFDKYYSHVNHGKVNTYSLDDDTANLYLEDVKYDMDESELELIYHNVKTINDNVINGNFTLKGFAPGKHHVSNVLGVVLTSLCLEIAEDKIIRGIGNYNGIPGRCNKRVFGNSVIIEEINPGINAKAIKESVEMVDDYLIVIGGDYGITCEEIDEYKVAQYLDTLNEDIVLTGDVGKGIQEKMTRNIDWIENYNECYEYAIKNSKNLLFIYRSDYRNIMRR